MAYGTTLVDNIQSSTANTPVVFKDGNGTQVGTLCRAWVNFNGTGTVAIRASFNVSSITDNGTGDYTVNFTTAMPDANYAVVGANGNYTTVGTTSRCLEVQDATTNSVKVISFISTTAARTDFDFINVSVFR